MTGLFEEAAAAMALTGEVAECALRAGYPGIEIQRMGYFWQVRLPRPDGTWVQTSAERLQQAIDSAVAMRGQP